MLIVDADGRVLTQVTLLLTPAEAAELADSARDLAVHPETGHHHINDRDYRNEITVSIDTSQAGGKLDPPRRER